MSGMYSVHLSISKVENGQYLAESEDIPGLVAQDVAKKLIESYIEHGDPIPASLKPVSDQIEIDVTVKV